MTKGPSDRFPRRADDGAMTMEYGAPFQNPQRHGPEGKLVNSVLRCLSGSPCLCSWNFLQMADASIAVVARVLDTYIIIFQDAASSFSKVPEGPTMRRPQITG